MAAATQTPCDGAGVHALGGAHADAVAAAGLLTEQQAHFDPLNADGQAGQLFQVSRVHAALLDLVPGQIHQGAAALKMIFQMVAGDTLRLHPLPGLGVEEQGVQLLHLRTGQNELCSHDVGVGSGGREPEAAGVRSEAGVEAVGDEGGDLHAHLADDLIQKLCRCGRIAVQQGEIRIAAVARMVVDAEIDMAGILRHAVVFAKELHAGNIHGHNGLGLKLAPERHRCGKAVAGRHCIGAEDSCRLAQRLERVAEGAAAADGVAVRVFMTQDQNVVRSTEALGHLLHIELFCHLMVPSFPQRWIYSSVSAGWESSASPFTFSVRSSSLMWAA